MKIITNEMLLLTITEIGEMLLFAKSNDIQLRMYFINEYYDRILVLIKLDYSQPITGYKLCLLTSRYGFFDVTKEKDYKEPVIYKADSALNYMNLAETIYLALEKIREEQNDN